MSDQTNEQGEKTGTGIIGVAAATGAGVVAGKYTGWNIGTDSQVRNRIETALTETLKNDAKEGAVKFQAEVVKAGAKRVKEDAPQTFAEKLLAEKALIERKGADALGKDALKVAQAGKKEAIEGIKLGLKEAKVGVLGLPQYGKAALVAIPAAIVTKMALDGMFGGHAAKVDADRSAPDQGTGRA